MQKHRSTRRIRRTSLVVGQVVGVTAAAAIVAGPVMAESISRDDRSTSRPGSYKGDTTGKHAIDPFGYSHSDSNAVLQNEHSNARRDYHAREPEPEPTTTTRGGTTTWTRTPSADGTGWAVCPARAAWC